MAREGPACTPSPVGKAWGGAGGQRAAERSRRLCDLDEFLTPHLVLGFHLCAMGVTMPTTSAYPFAGIGVGGVPAASGAPCAMTAADATPVFFTLYQRRSSYFILVSFGAKLHDCPGPAVRCSELGGASPSRG